MKSFSTILVLTLLVLNTACSRKTEQAPLPDFKQLVLEQYIEPFKNAEIDRWMQVFADDAVGMHNTLPPFVGKEAINGFGNMVAENLKIEQMDIVIDNVRVKGDWALTRGSFTSKMIPKDMTDSSAIPSNKGKFILLWERQEDEQWKVILDMGNSNEGPPPPA